MREIKFRAWLDYENGSGEMLPNVQNHINGKWAFGHIVNGSVDNVSEPMQYTGLKDKNGVEIYEGDVFHDGIQNSVIEWCERVAAFVANDGAERHFLGAHICCEEIIGNIHENPELVNAQ